MIFFQHSREVFRTECGVGIYVNHSVLLSVIPAAVVAVVSGIDYDLYRGPEN